MNGLILINKEKDWTSRDVVNKIGHILNTTKVGHTGTLDPLATGVLVVAVGDAVKIVNLLVCDTKEYIAEATCGIKTDTLDITGNILEEKDFVLDKDKLKDVLNSFVGKYEQEVPLYSSVKVEGRRLYDYARNNIDVSLPKREVEIFSLELLDVTSNSFKFKVLVSKGTYIRSLIRDIGDKLNILCTMSNLQRTRQGKYKIEDCFNISDVENNNYKIVSLREALSDYPIIYVDSYLENRIRNGSILENRYEDKYIVFVNKKDEVLAIYEIYSKDPNKIKPFHVFNL